MNGKKAQLGEILLEKKLINNDQLQAALATQKATGQKIGKILVDANIISEAILLQTLSEQLKIPFVELSHYTAPKNLTYTLPENHARFFQAILLDETDKEYVVGMVDPLNIFAIDELERILGRPIKPVLVSESGLLATLDQLYRRTGEIHTFAGKLASELKPSAAAIASEKDDAVKKSDPAVIKLLNSLFEDAIQINASDIHIEPAEKILRIRLRVDGLLQEQIIPLTEEHIGTALSRRLKLMAGLNMSETRLPQDGRFDIKVRELPIDVRLSIMPTQYGESIVMRLLNKASKIIDLNTTGMPQSMLERYRQLIRIPYGIILVTGPTGSGKTTTLYGSLVEINDVTKNIVTIEDPIEYRLERANQVQVNTQIELTFARILRATLRQDPNIILVGEIRDQETASIAMRAALTGHLVFATLHTRDAANTALRLIDIGVEGYLVASTVRAILAQRLMRYICDSCIEDYKPSTPELNYFAGFFGDVVKTSTFKHGVGCSHCNHTGYKGRFGIFELLEMNVPMGDALRNNDSHAFMQAANANKKWPSLLEHAFEMARQGITTLSEVMRIAGEQN